MPIELRITGPGLDTTRIIGDGDAELVLGRDADSGICLPDPQRNVSRRHLAVWSEAGELHFHVLSVVNGVEMPFGEAPPGARGVLALGQTARLGDYSLCGQATAAAPPAPAPQDDPWAVFDREGSGIAPVPQEDPFGDWGFESTFGPGSQAGSIHAPAPGAAAPDLSAFFTGLGLDPAKIGPLSPGELEAIGRTVRDTLDGLFQLQASAVRVKGDLRAEDRTMVASRDNNPLRSDWPPATRLQYLFGGRMASVGFIDPQRAVRDLLGELLAHQAAMASAARAVVEGTLAELSPPVLKSQLPAAGSKLFESSRLWDAYAKYHAEQGAQMDAWVQRLLDKYFSGAYLREAARIRRDAGHPSNGG